MASRGCTSCGRANPVGNTFCQYCGAHLSNLTPPAPVVAAAPAAPPLRTTSPAGAPAMAWQPPPPLWPPQNSGQGMWPAFEAARTQGLREHTRTGLLLMAVGFGLSWIPYINFIGGLLALIGVILLLLGRHGFDEAHHRNVVVGVLLLFISFLATLAVTAIFLSNLLGSARTPGSTASSVVNDLTGQLQSLFIALAVIGILSAIAQVLLPYALADSTDRLLLWGGFLSGVAISILTAIVILGAVDSAVRAATVGGVYNPGPIQDLQTQANLLGLAKVLPDGLLAYAYYRIHLRVGNLPPPT